MFAINNTKEEKKTKFISYFFASIQYEINTIREAENNIINHLKDLFNEKNKIFDR